MFTSDRGRIQPPNLDDRLWQDLVDEALALIPKYAPQWTDYSPGDPGRTLIELFAWLVEGLTYRLNRVPEKNYIAFLNLLGITRDPAVPAHAFLTFTAQPPVAGHPVAPILVPQKTQAHTMGSETEAPIAFETDEDVQILPLNLKTVLLVQWNTWNTTTKQGTYTDITGDLATAMVSGYPVTLPGAPGVQSGQPAQPATPVQLLLGFDGPTSLPIQLSIRLSLPVQVTSSGGNDQAQVAVGWTYSTATNEPSAWIAPSGVIDNTSGLLRDGTVSITVPANWTSQAPSSWTRVTPASTTAPINDARFWLAITLTNTIQATAANPAPPIQIGFNYLLFNSVSAHNALTIPNPEPLGQSDGTTPFQVFQLKNRPLFKRPGTNTPYDHLEIQVNGTTWTQVDDFPAGAGNVYRLNPVTGEISFGNFDPTRGQPGTHGTIPPASAQITAVTYRYVAGGLSGNVGIGQVTALSKLLPGIAGVTNLSASFDAADEETIEDTLNRAPLELKSRDRAVTVEDYEVLAREASKEVAIARCLAPRLHDDQGASGTWNIGDPWLFAGINRAPGNVNMIIVPDQGKNIARPTPSKDLLQEVQAYLDKRRDLTASLLVSGPYYLPITVVVKVIVWKRGISQGLIGGPNDVVTDMQHKLQQYLHPIYGGLDGKGWQVGQSVFIADLFKAIMPAENIGFISSLTLAAENPPAYKPGPYPTQPASSDAWVSVADYELACYGTGSTITPTTL